MNVGEKRIRMGVSESERSNFFLTFVTTTCLPANTPIRRHAHTPIRFSSGGTIKQLKSRQFAPMRQGENLSFTLLYATSGFFAQYGIESHFKAFRQTVRQGGDVARPGLTECDGSADAGGVVHFAGLFRNRDVPAGEGVGYAARFVTKRPRSRLTIRQRSRVLQEWPPTIAFPSNVP